MRLISGSLSGESAGQAGEASFCAMQDVSVFLGLSTITPCRTTVRQNITVAMGADRL